MTIDKDKLSVAKLPDPKISTAFPQLVESEELSMNRIQDDESSAQCHSLLLLTAQLQPSSVITNEPTADMRPDVDSSVSSVIDSNSSSPSSAPTYS